MLCPAWVKSGTHYAFFILVKVEDADGGGVIISSWIMGVTDESAIGGETLCVVAIGPVADMRVVRETPDTKIIARGGKNDLLCLD
ncbi:MAG: hypothetical protein COA78_04915 [Blastopirellula sp.]|nr:MAG: hypothetical protein COA78_04915 [Blastopirellula sp.]